MIFCSFTYVCLRIINEVGSDYITYTGRIICERWKGANLTKFEDFSADLSGEIDVNHELLRIAALRPEFEATVSGM
jgi:hypothetical protein